MNKFILSKMENDEAQFVHLQQLDANSYIRNLKKNTDFCRVRKTRPFEYFCASEETMNQK